MVDDDVMIWAADVCAMYRIVPRTLAKWIAARRFPAAAGNVAGRRYWTRAQLRAHRAAMTAGQFAVERRPPGQRAQASVP